MAHRMREELLICEVHKGYTKPELWIAQDALGVGVKSTEQVVIHSMESEVMRSETRPAKANIRRSEMGRVLLIRVVDDVTRYTCSFKSPQEAWPIE